MNRSLVAFILLVLVGVLLFVSCGGTTNKTCYWKSLTVYPQNATANHLATPPGNQVQFAGNGTISDGCAAIAQGSGANPSVLPNVTNLEWTTSDPVNTTITSSPNDSGTNGVATCVGRTAVPATITGKLTADRNSGVVLTATSTLTCQ